MEAALKKVSSAPLVTFVVPCYNYAHFLAICVNSILLQDYENFEVLIMDNCSTDNTPEVAQSFQDARVRHIRNESNLGSTQNFNKGLTLARGKYVWLLSADDLLRSPNVLGRYVDVMEQNADLGFVFCRAIELLGEREGTISRWADCGEQDCIWHGSNFLWRLIESCCVILSSVMVRKECLNRVGLFPTDLPYADDWYLLSMLAMHYGVAYLAEPMVFYRIHPDSLTIQQGREYAQICVGDELNVLWRVGHEAELAQKPQLRDACHVGFIRLARRYLMTELWGTGPHISATEFEGILKSRFQNSNGLQRIRNSVYTSLAEEVRSLLYYVPDAPIDCAEEISSYWDLWRHAELAGVPDLRDACKLGLAHRLSRRLQDGTFNVTSSGSETGFAEILQSRIPDAEAAKDIRALVYRNLGDQQYTRREYAEATQSYRLALEVCPGHLATSAKYLLMRMGVPGIWIRQLAGQVRESSRRVGHARQQSSEPAKADLVVRHPRH
jgi:glycosyltransferase involved in cell wall biosynthesis